jgi:hypothetical protein
MLAAGIASAFEILLYYITLTKQKVTDFHHWQKQLQRWD